VLQGAKDGVELNIIFKIRPALEVAHECENAVMGGLNADTKISKCANAGFAAPGVPKF
jgi:hypothetical protein